MAMTDEEEAAIKADLDSTKAALKKANDEAKGHRLNAENFRTTAEERKAALDAAKADYEKSLTATRDELTGKMTAAEQAAADRDKASKERVTRADLSIAAKDAGMKKLEYLKLVDSAALKIGDDGSVTNATEVLAEMKKNNPELFGAASTSHAGDPPKPNDPGNPKKYADMTPAEQKSWKREQGLR